MIMGEQFSAYDERPDPKKPGQQGVLFRKEAPARGTPDERRGIVPDRWGDVHDTRITEKGRVRGISNELYHGTSARLKPGSLIRPGMPANYEGVNMGHGITQDVNHEHVFTTPELGLAHMFARVAQETRGQRNNTGYARAHVYRVQPTGPVQSDPETDREMYDPGFNDMGYDYEPGEVNSAAYQSKHPLRVLSKVQFPEHQEAYRSYMEDEMGERPGEYPYAPKVPKDWY